MRLPSDCLGAGSAGLPRKASWFQIKEDKATAVTTVYVILRVEDNLKTILAPILPHTAQQLHEYRGYEGHPDEICRQGPDDRLGSLWQQC